MRQVQWQFSHGGEGKVMGKDGRFYQLLLTDGGASFKEGVEYIRSRDEGLSAIQRQIGRAKGVFKNAHMPKISNKLSWKSWSLNTLGEIVPDQYWRVIQSSGTPGKRIPQEDKKSRFQPAIVDPSFQT
jgi:hypothetical protein